MPNFDKTRPVLIIDDCPMYRTAAKGMLLKLGFENSLVFFAKDAANAIEQCRSRHFQLVLCDYNLGEGANGHQLIEQLQHSQLMAMDCVLAIVTADASAEVVRGFAELNPDGYLVKPLNFANLSKRLPSIARKKLSLAKVHEAMAQANYQQVLSLVDEMVVVGNEYSVAGLFLKADALMHEKRFDEARNLLVGLNQGAEKAKVSLALSELALKQKQYPTVEALLQPLENDPVHAAHVKEKMAINLLHQQRIDEAYEKIKDAVQHSPKNTQRQIFKVQIAMANFSIEQAYSDMLTALNQARHSFRETLGLHQQAAQLTLDFAQLLSDAGEKNKLQQRLVEQCKTWRARYARKNYKPMECLLLARANGIHGYIAKARRYLTEYQNLIAEEQHYQASPYEQVELAKVFQLLGFQEQYRTQAPIAQRALSQLNNANEGLCLLRYLSKWQERVDSFNAKAEKLKQLGDQAFCEGRYEVSTELFVKALDLNRGDVEIPAKLIASLTKAWPMGWSKKQVTDLAVRCRDLVYGSLAASKPNYLSSLQILSNQLQLKELDAIVA